MPEKPTISPETAEIIRRKKAQYCRFADGLEWDRFDTIMLPDFVFEGLDTDGAVLVQNGVRYRWESRDAWVAHFSEAFKAMQTMHLVDPGDLEQVAEDEVRAVFGVVYFGGTRGTEAGLHSTGGGHYYETWKKVDGDWFMASSSMKRLYSKVQGV
ncbi:bile acid 7-alpha protein [Colletotrichum tofieldiae]|uniref:Bile acid 7-alpha protein n=1 Tax=Colletotrichum tofieldiae TaxID=708197 RepID=A0A166YES0_9PEZI|nr:Bile acid 7-alpha protein [Colletotrichum tofieldiae]GKT56998.1 bile acid 7-alpha protein [Colletotrichum tofieldiae]GKT78728.1 bile acid 7-alpha protein [Colletotrichum tofieldiae]